MHKGKEGMTGADWPRCAHGAYLIDSCGLCHATALAEGHKLLAKQEMWYLHNTFIGEPWLKVDHGLWDSGAATIVAPKPT